MKPTMNLTSPWRDDHSILWLYVEILKTNHGVLGL